MEKKNLCPICGQPTRVYMGKTAEDVFGYVDSLKLKSCLTLFAEATNDQLFAYVLSKYFDGKRDQNTIELIDQNDWPPRFEISWFEA